MKKYFQVTKIGTVGELEKKKKETAKVGKKQDKTDDAPENENNFLHVNKRGF